MQGYYLSSNRLTFDQGQYFCSNHCNSDLASIHNITQFSEVLITINASHSIHKMDTRPDWVWIGLYNHSTSSTFIWLDGTEFDYGSTIFPLRTSPWLTNHPNNE